MAERARSGQSCAHDRSCEVAFPAGSSDLGCVGVGVERAGYLAQIVDANWRYVFVTDELSVTCQALGLPAIPIGAHLLSAEGVQAELGGSWPSPEVRRAWFLTAGRYVLRARRAAARSFVGSSIPSSRTWWMSCKRSTIRSCPYWPRCATAPPPSETSPPDRRRAARTRTPHHSDHVSDRGQPQTRCRLLCGDQAGGGDVASRRRDRRTQLVHLERMRRR